MKKILLLLLVFIFSACGEKDELNVMTFNIRYASPNDGINIWDNRKEMCVDVFKEKNVDIAGLQEVLKHQLDYLTENLPDYEVYGIGRDDGKEAGEHMPVLYRKDRFELLEKNTFWLSETPNKPGNLCWNTVCNRVCSWVKLKDKHSNEIIYFFNTHFSHVSDEARRKSADMLLKEIAKIAGGSKVILTGDFNLTMDSVAYQKLVKNPAMKMVDASTNNTFTENDHTFNGWGKGDFKPIIDYIFTSQNMSAIEYEIFTKKMSGVYISDHYPVISKLKI